jgi:hypothetical protein
MRKFLSISSGVALALLFCFSLHGLAANPAEPPAPAQDGTMPALTAIAGQGMMSNEAYDDLEELSDYIGGRVTGSTEAGQAIQWGMQKMRAMGLENVRYGTNAAKDVQDTLDLIAQIEKAIQAESGGEN